MDRIIDQAAAVRQRLQSTPGIFSVPTQDLEMFVLPNFLTPADCAGLIELIDNDRQPSTLLADSPDPEFRTSESCNLNPSHPLVITIETKLASAMGIDRPYGETIQGQRYAVGQQFKPHHDFFHTDQPYWPAQEKSGGQRTWTAMAFLNAPEEGGHTMFPAVKVKISPRAGNLLIWNNLSEDGLPNPKSLHQGMPVLKGVKYVITKWYRERPWLSGPDDQSPY